MPKIFYCSKGTSQHPRPVDKICQVAGDSLVGDVEVIAPPPLPLNVQPEFGVQPNTVKVTAARGQDGHDGL